jgi:hypothetical protein
MVIVCVVNHFFKKGPDNNKQGALSSAAVFVISSHYKRDEAISKMFGLERQQRQNQEEGR